MKLLLALVLFLSTVAVFSQTQFEIREKIVPLRSSRADVEKIARFEKDYSNFTRYKMGDEFIDVYYSKEKCIGHGWNVPTNTVLSFRFFPKKSLMLKDVLKMNSKLVQITDDGSMNYFINQSAGIVYVLGQFGIEEIEHIVFAPLPTDASLRCKGFPQYSLVSNYYTRFQFMEIDNIAEWDVGLIYMTLHRVRENPNLKSYVFIYCKESEQNKCRELKKNIEKFAFNSYNFKANQIIITLGGNRSNTEIETFLIPKDYPPLVAKPMFPSGF